MAVNWLFYDYVRPKHILYSRLKKFINDFLANPELQNAKLIDIEDGMLVATKK